MRRRLRIGRVQAIATLAVGIILAARAPSAQISRLTPWLETAIRQTGGEAHHLVWIYLRDKGSDVTTRLGDSGASTSISARARIRRTLRGRLDANAAFEDLGLEPRYIDEIRRRVTRIRHESRWLNAVSAEATAEQVAAIASLPFVSRVDVVRRYRRDREETVEPIDARESPPRGGLGPGASLDYGTSLEQLSQIRVPELHARGLTGQSIVVAVFDAGFPGLDHNAFTGMTILSERDFVHGIDNVRSSTDAHGMATLSTIGGMSEGELIGPAYGASFVLAVTEDSRSETPIEEDNWAAAAEWAEGMGVDVISASLGYSTFDFPYTSYTYRDMNGETAISTRAANMAAARGVVVVSSAGNGGFRADRNTLVAPADGMRVLGIGAVAIDGTRAPFSSVGPTSDGRTKPDVAALGIRAKVAWPGASDSYVRASGTSFSCPLTAGVVALMLQAHPAASVDQVLLAIRSTASQAAKPDNQLGWGIVDAVGAVDAVVDGR